MNLLAKKCIPCSIKTEPLNGEEIQNYLKMLAEDWELVDHAYIKKTFNFPDFKEALAFVNRIGEIAEKEGHHPEITLNWGRVIVKLMTFKIQGLHENDFILAAKIDEVL